VLIPFHHHQKTFKGKHGDKKLGPTFIEKLTLEN
jgi:hypothetical protein